jgi:3-deoxy-manno-octulosonate cytidylyltransferase (CMP-KDO synthetase)
MGGVHSYQPTVSAILGVIPARIGSERLPRKPLHPIAGRPLIEWVWRRVRSFPGLDAVVVATDSEEIRGACAGIGADVVLTAATHGSGTERVAEVASMAAHAGFEVVVNVQGDEPFVTEAQVMGAVHAVTTGWDVGTVAAPVGTLEAWNDPSVVKVVRNRQGGALYFSRAPIPHIRGRDPTPDELASGPCLRHIGVYAYTRDALGRWVETPPVELEQLERLEQLRALDIGLRIGVQVVERGGDGIDTPADVIRAEERLLSEGFET